MFWDVFDVSILYVTSPPKQPLCIYQGITYDHVELNLYLNGKNMHCPASGIRGTVYPVVYGNSICNILNILCFLFYCINLDQSDLCCVAKLQQLTLNCILFIFSTRIYPLEGHVFTHWPSTGWHHGQNMISWSIFVFRFVHRNLLSPCEAFIIFSFVWYFSLASFFKETLGTIWKLK